MTVYQKSEYPTHIKYPTEWITKLPCPTEYLLYIEYPIEYRSNTYLISIPTEYLLYIEYPTEYYPNLSDRSDTIQQVNIPCLTEYPTERITKLPCPNEYQPNTFPISIPTENLPRPTEYLLYIEYPTEYPTEWITELPCPTESQQNRSDRSDIDQKMNLPCPTEYLLYIEYPSPTEYQPNTYLISIPTEYLLYIEYPIDYPSECYQSGGERLKKILSGGSWRNLYGSEIYKNLSVNNNIFRYEKVEFDVQSR